MYDSVLQGYYDDVTLQAIEDYINDVTPRNPYGLPISGSSTSDALSNSI